MTTSTRASLLAPFRIGLLLAVAAVVIVAGDGQASVASVLHGERGPVGATVRYKPGPGASQAYRGGSGYSRGDHGGSGYSRGYRGGSGYSRGYRGGPVYRGSPGPRSWSRYGSGYLYPRNHNYWRGYRRAYRPRAHVSLRIGLGWPYGYPSYPYGDCPYDGYGTYYDVRPRVIERRVVVERDRADDDGDDDSQVAPAPDDEESGERVAPAPGDADLEVNVENLPPAGCYYHDPYCHREFRDLDTYTEHLDREQHAKAIDVIERESGRRLRTLEFDGEVWGVKPQ